MLDSVRVRLTLWYTGVLILVLLPLSVGTYLLVVRAMEQRTFNSLAESSKGFLATLQSEYKNQIKERVGPEALLRRLAMNLLDNAIKYTPAGGTVRVACERAGSEYSLTVRDSGPGIPAEAQEKIFERFFRLDPARTQNRDALAAPESAAPATAGAGLGLAIARWIAEAHHGRLVLVQSDASGSTFTAFLPASGVDAAELTGATHSQHESRAEPIRA